MSEPAIPEAPLPTTARDKTLDKTLDKTVDKMRTRHE
jgi:hypothetical protein